MRKQESRGLIDFLAASGPDILDAIRGETELLFQI